MKNVGESVVHVTTERMSGGEYTSVVNFLIECLYPRSINVPSSHSSSRERSTGSVTHAEPSSKSTKVVDDATREKEGRV